MAQRTGLAAFLLWIPIGACAALGLAAAPSFGLFLLPFAVVAIVVARWKLRPWPEALGAGLGVGVVLLVVAIANNDYRACSGGPITVAPGESSVSCGGLDPAPFLLMGLALCASAAVLYFTLRRRARQ
jgi:hypothetical protein